MTRARVFGRGADDYDRLRPGAGPEAVDWLLPPGRHAVLDLAAGSGLVTRALASRARRVIAVEPDARMLARLSARAVDTPAPHPAAVRGLAEELPLAAHSVDAVIVASAWHWLDPDRAVPEIARVLRPGGTLGVLWSRADPATPWIAALRREAGMSEGGTAPTVTLPAGAPFTAAEHADFPWVRSMSRDDVADLVTTYSTVLARPEPERDEVRRRARAHLDAALPDAGAVLDVPIATRAWRARRTG